MNVSSKSLVRLAGEGIVITSSASFFMKIVSLIGTLIVLNALSPYNFGIWQLSLGILTGFTLLIFSFLSGLIVTDIAHEIGRKNIKTANYIVSKAFTFFFFTGLGAAVLMATAAPFVTIISGLQITPYLFILSISLAFSGFQQINTIIFQAYLRPVSAAIFNSIITISFVACTAFFVLFLDWNLIGVALAYTLSRVFPVIVFAPITAKFLIDAFNNQQKDKISFLRSLWIRGKFVFAGDWVTTGIGSLWPWVAGYFLGVETVGLIYVAIMMLAQVSGFVPMSYILRSILPHFAQETKRMENWLIRSMRYSLFVHGIVGIGLLVGAYFLFPFIFPAYIAAVPIYAWLLLCLPQRALGDVVGEWFHATQRQKELFYVTAIPKVVTTLFLPPLILIFGLPGFIAWFLLYTNSVVLTRLLYMRFLLRNSFSLRKIILFDRHDWGLVLRAFSFIRNILKRKLIFSYRNNI